MGKRKEEFKSLIKYLGKYLDEKEMGLNTDKIKIIRFSQVKGSEPNEKYYRREIKVEKVKSIKYLYISKKL